MLLLRNFYSVSRCKISYRVVLIYCTCFVVNFKRMRSAPPPEKNRLEHFEGPFAGASWMTIPFFLSTNFELLNFKRKCRFPLFQPYGVLSSLAHSFPVIHVLQLSFHLLKSDLQADRRKFFSLKVENDGR